MALVHTSRAIGKATEWLRQNLEIRSGLQVTVGRPEPDSRVTPAPIPHLNLFLYEAAFDPFLKNTALTDSAPPPLWLVLKYLLTAFDEQGSSDTVEALENQGRGLVALQSLSFLGLNTIAIPADILVALKDNPETLKITFDEAPAELLAKLMQGSEERYRFSCAFQMRPVMVAPAETPPYHLLVGVDYTTMPPTEIGEAGIQIPVIPSIGASIKGVVPETFELGDMLTLYGTDLNLSRQVVRLGAAQFEPSAQQANWLQFVVSETVLENAGISAGSHVLAVVQMLPNGREISSSLLVGTLRPRIDSLSASVSVSPGLPLITGTLELSGRLLGRPRDTIRVALYQHGATLSAIDDGFSTSADQRTLIVPLTSADQVAPGVYQVIVNINGAQALSSPTVALGV